jgi:hypothetical protein
VTGDAVASHEEQSHSGKAILLELIETLERDNELRDRFKQVLAIGGQD